AQAMLAR
ncbi:hypothetical protein MKD33_12505, partial [Chromobacterium piscinae]